jgi:hypothetical protein
MRVRRRRNPKWDVTLSEEAIRWSLAIGLLEKRQMTEDDCRVGGFGAPGDLYLVVNKEFVEAHAYDIAYAYLEKLTQRDGFDGVNQKRRQTAAGRRHLYRTTASAIVKKNPQLDGNISAQARAVIQELKMLESRFERVRKALSSD